MKVDNAKKEKWGMLFQRYRNSSPFSSELGLKDFRIIGLCHTCESKLPLKNKALCHSERSEESIFNQLKINYQNQDGRDVRIFRMVR